MFTLVMFIGLSLLQAVPVEANPTTYYVKTDGNDEKDGTSWDNALKTIGKAISVAHSGDTIEVLAGTYNEAITINKGLTLRSIEEHAATIDASGAAYAIDLKADNVTIDGFKIRRATSRGINFSGGGFTKINNTTITNNVIEDNGEGGIYFHRLGDNNEVERNTIQNNGAYGIQLNSPASDSPATGNKFNNNIIINNGARGIYVQGYGFDGNEIEENTISGHQKYGIYLGQAGIRNNTIKNNIIDDNNKDGYSGVGPASGDGIFIESGGNYPGAHTQGNIIKGNTITKHWNGIYFKGSRDGLYHHDNEIVANTIEFNSGNGIYLEESSQNTIEENSIKNNNRSGIFLKTTSSGDGSDDNIIKENRIVDNRQTGLSSDGNSNNNIATHNWWGDASGPKHETTNPNGTGNAVSDNVLYYPWYTNASLTKLSNFITLTKTGPANAKQGDVITYTIKYKNEGNFPETNVVITETYPPEVEFVEASPAPDANINNKWTIGDLDPGEERTITVKVRIK